MHQEGTGNPGMSGGSFPVNNNVVQMHQERKTEDPGLQSLMPAASLPVNNDIKQTDQRIKTKHPIRNIGRFS